MTPFKVLETPRLILRRLSVNDYGSLCKVLQNPETRYPWGYAFNNEEVTDWLNTNLQRYATKGYGYLAAIDKVSGKFIGVIGLVDEKTDREEVLGLNYILANQFSGQGYALEGARVCLDTAFTELDAERVCSQIRPENNAARRVAQKLGMKVLGGYIRRINGLELPHLIYCIHNPAKL